MKIKQNMLKQRKIKREKSKRGRRVIVSMIIGEGYRKYYCNHKFFA